MWRRFKPLEHGLQSSRAAAMASTSSDSYRPRSRNDCRWPTQEHPPRSGNIDTFNLPDEDFDSIICHTRLGSRKPVIASSKYANKAQRLGHCYISYNTLPGWRITHYSHMMRYHFAWTARKTRSIKGVPWFNCSGACFGGDMSVYGQFIRQQVNFISRSRIFVP